jgi:pimeloyl-ACP methyl ester carboxylesterase
MASSVAEGIKKWAEGSSRTKWATDYAERIVGRRQPRAVPRIVVHSEQSRHPTFVISESNWSELTKDRFRAYTIRRWLGNTLDSAGEALRPLNRKNGLESLFALAPFLFGFGIIFALALAVEAAQRLDPHDGIVSLPYFLFVTLAAISLLRAIARPFLPRFRLRARLYWESRHHYAKLPDALRHALSIFDAVTVGQHDDISNAILALWSVIRGSIAATFYLAVAFIYALVFCNLATIRTATTKCRPIDVAAIVTVAVLLRFAFLVLRSFKKIYEPLEDIFSYIDPSPQARSARNDAIQRISADLRRFITASDLDGVVLLGHSLGSVLLVDALAEVIRDVLAHRFDSAHLGKLRGVVLYGSPLQKILVQVRSLHPSRFASDILRWSIAFLFLRKAAQNLGGPLCHNFYYLTDVVSEKIVDDDDRLVNHLLPSPWHPWSHGRYHADARFWSALRDVGVLPEIEEACIARAESEPDSPYVVPARWPAPSWRQIAWGIPKCLVLFASMFFALAMVARGVSGLWAFVFVFAVFIVLELQLKD